MDSPPKIPRQSQRAHKQSLLQARVAELEGTLEATSAELAKIKRRDSDLARQALLQSDGSLSYLSYSGASGRRGPALMISCVAKGQPLLRTALTVDGKDFGAVYARAIDLLADAFGVSDDAGLKADMLATMDRFLADRKLRLVEVKYRQVLPADWP